MAPQFNPMMQMQPTPLLQLPQVDASALDKLAEITEKKQFVGNTIYPVIE